MANRWDEALWDEDRWATLTVPDLLLQPPPTSRGVPVGQADWRLVVEILLPTDGSAVWGVAAWDEDAWAQLAWVDITTEVRGMEWRRGSDEVYGRPRVGIISLTLSNGSGQFDPWLAPSAQYLAPGTILRAGLVSPTGIDGSPDYGIVRWLPQWTGIVETWAPLLDGSLLDDFTASDRWVEVTLNETLRDLAQVDDLALPSPVGAGEPVRDRIPRLTDAAAWRYGLLIEAQNVVSSDYPVQSTEMAQNRLAELYLTADSSDSQFRSLRDGRAGLTASEYAGSGTAPADLAAQPLALVSWYYNTAGAGSRIPVYLLGPSDQISDPDPDYLYVTGAYRAESFRSQAQDSEISNNVILAAVGRDQQQWRQLASIQRYGERSYVRSDYLNSTDEPVALIARYISIRRALATLRIEAVEVDTWARPLPQFLATVLVEPGDKSFVYAPFLRSDLVRPSIYGLVAEIAHKVTPRVAGSSMVWTSEIRVDTRTVFNVPGAQLPATDP